MSIETLEELLEINNRKTAIMNNMDKILQEMKLNFETRDKLNSELSKIQNERHELEIKEISTEESEKISTLLKEEINLKKSVTKVENTLENLYVSKKLQDEELEKIEELKKSVESKDKVQEVKKDEYDGTVEINKNINAVYDTIDSRKNSVCEVYGHNAARVVKWNFMMNTEEKIKISEELCNVIKNAGFISPVDLDEKSKIELQKKFKREKMFDLIKADIEEYSKNNPKEAEKEEKEVNLKPLVDVPEENNQPTEVNSEPKEEPIANENKESENTSEIPVETKEQEVNQPTEVNSEPKEEPIVNLNKESENTSEIPVETKEQENNQPTEVNSEPKEEPIVNLNKESENTSEIPVEAKEQENNQPTEVNPESKEEPIANENKESENTSEIPVETKEQENNQVNVFNLGEIKKENTDSNVQAAIPVSNDIPNVNLFSAVANNAPASVSEIPVINNQNNNLVSPENSNSSQTEIGNNDDSSMHNVNFNTNKVATVSPKEKIAKITKIWSDYSKDLNVDAIVDDNKKVINIKNKDGLLKNEQEQSNLFTFPSINNPVQNTNENVVNNENISQSEDSNSIFAQAENNIKGMVA